MRAASVTTVPVLTAGKTVTARQQGHLERKCSARRPDGERIIITSVTGASTRHQIQKILTIFVGNFLYQTPSSSFGYFTCINDFIYLAYITMNADEVSVECSWEVENLEEIHKKILWKDRLSDLTAETNAENCFKVSQQNPESGPCKLKIVLKKNRKFAALQILSEVS